jgi:hypothetical protein
MIYNANQYADIRRNDHPVYRYRWDDVDLGDIKRFVRDYHSRRHGQVCLHEFGLDGVRFDFVGVDPFRQRVRVLEYKVAREDFLGDRKHLRYMRYCSTLAFVTPLGLVGADDMVDGRTGLLQVFRWQRRDARVDRWTLGAIWLKRPRGLTLDREVYCRVVGAMLLRLVQGRREDFF